MNSGFSLQSRLEGQCLVVAASGYLNNQGGEMIADECYKHMATGVHNVILDLKNSKMVNSVGISILIEIIEKLMEKKGKLVFTNLDPAVEKTFTIMGLFQLATKYQTTEEALASLSGK